MFWHNPNDPLQCAHQYACPHLGGAALSIVVDWGNEADRQANQSFHEVERLRKEITQRDKQLDQLRAEIEDLRRELQAVHRRAFQKHRDPHDVNDDGEEAPETSPVASASASATAGAESAAKKRGAPVGHPGWFRPMPTEFDRTEEVVPTHCCHCGGDVRVDAAGVVHEHVQEDWVEGRVEAVCFRHPAARCLVCGRAVEVAGPGELLGCPIGPSIKARAEYLHFEIGLSSRKVQAICAELLGFTFVPASVLGFDQQAARRAEPLATDIANKLGFSAVVYADETYWTINAVGAYVWFHGNEDLAYFQIDTSRAGEVSRQILGEKFDGILSTDCYSGYEKHRARAKQKCLAHVRRTAKDWLPLVPADSQAVVFFTDVVTWVRRACDLYRHRAGAWTDAHQQEITWLRTELKRLESVAVDHARAERLQKRLRKYHDEWLTFIDHPEVAPTNNLAERALRPLVILRKLTYGNRSRAGTHRLGVMHSVLETAKRQGHAVLSFLRELLLQPKEYMQVALYRPSG